MKNHRKLPPEVKERRAKKRSEKTKIQREKRLQEKAAEEVERQIEKDLRKAIHWSRAGFGAVLKGYEPPSTCVKIAECMIQGIVQHTEICEQLGIDPDEYTACMKKPENMAWVSRVMMEHLQDLFGFLDFRMYQQAAKGNVTAYRALMERFGKAAEKKSLAVHAHLSSKAGDFDHLSDDQVEKILQDERRRQGLIIDVAPEEAVSGGEGTEGTPDPSPEGT